VVAPTSGAKKKWNLGAQLQHSQSNNIKIIFEFKRLDAEVDSTVSVI